MLFNVRYLLEIHCCKYFSSLQETEARPGLWTSHFLSVILTSLNQVPRPDGKPDHLGLLVLDEPSTKQSDPTVLSLWLTENSKQHNITVSSWSKSGPRSELHCHLYSVDHCLLKGVWLQTRRGFQ